MKKVLIPAGAFFLPMLAFAATNFDANDVLTTIRNIIDGATPIVVALALLYFFWGLAQYILNSADEEKKSEGRNIMIWGIIAIFVMLSVFGIVQILQNTFGVESNSLSPDVPRVQNIFTR